MLHFWMLWNWSKDRIFIFQRYTEIFDVKILMKNFWWGHDDFIDSINLDKGSGDTVHLTLLSDEEYQILKAEVEGN